MASVKLKMSKHQKNTPLSNIFIDQYMPYAHPTFVIVYILGLRYCYSTKNELTTRNIADTLHILESDVIRAWRYWDDMGILELHEDMETQQFSIEYLQINSDNQIPPPNFQNTQIKTNQNKISTDPQIKPTLTETSVENNKKESDTKSSSGNGSFNKMVMETKPVYSAQELDFYIQNNTDVRKLFKSAEHCLGKLLSYNDMNMLFSFHDWLRLPMDVIDLLLNYCTSNNHRNMRYIEKVALEWADRNINTVERAKEHIKLYNTDFKAIMKSFGISNREPALSEIEFMTKWLKIYKISQELVQEACKKAILQTGKPNFPYADRIITSWYDNHISTLEEVSVVEAEFTQERQIKSDQDKIKQDNINQNIIRQNNIRQNNPRRKNKFVNYEQREWNFKELEELEENYIDNKLKK